MWLNCIFATVLVIAGILLRRLKHGYPFLGLVCYALAGILLIYGGINLLPQPAIPRTIFTLILLLGCTTYGITELLLVLAGRGTVTASCPCIIVLGCKIIDGEPSISLLDRIHAAGNYLQRNPETVAILSGSQCENKSMSEAQFMLDRLTEMGICPARLIVEDRSQNTWENLRFSTKLLMEKFGSVPENVGLLSSEYHLFRAAMHAKKQGLQVLTIPARTSHFLTKLNGYLREGAGVWHSIILGGLYHD